MRMIAAISSAALMFGCAATDGAPTGRQAARERALAMQPVGEPIDCVQTTDIRSTRVIDAQTIDFEMRGGQVLRNRLPQSCPSLTFEESFSYSPTGSRLCSVDIITVLNQTGGRPTPGPSCGLGKFQRVQAPPQ